LAGSRPILRFASKNFQKNNIRLSHSYGGLQNRAFIALGSNMGDRVEMIEHACKLMEATGEVKVLQTSSLYETKAMYVLDQDNFVNGACEVRSFFLYRRTAANVDR
jgi:2-amino-4-hydroxy-6-hydroxymethyldihydropteridine diphosphokinase / dihydropteroate synthase